MSEDDVVVPHASADDNDMVETDGSAITPPPPPAKGLGDQLEPGLRQKLHDLLLGASGQLGEVYLQKVLHPSAGPTELLSWVEAANGGVIANRLVVIYAIMREQMPKGPSVARQAASSVRTLLKVVVDPEVETFLKQVLSNLGSVYNDSSAVTAENAQLQADSVQLQTQLKAASGVYVYTYPNYWHHPILPDSERRLLKVGRTQNQAWNRILTQAKQTGMPEDPLLLRVYVTPNAVTVEHQFHLLLDAAEHARAAGVAVGKEWFATTLEFLDTIATVLGLQVLKGSVDA